MCTATRQLRVSEETWRSRFLFTRIQVQLATDIFYIFFNDFILVSINTTARTHTRTCASVQFQWLNDSAPIIIIDIDSTFSLYSVRFFFSFNPFIWKKSRSKLFIEISHFWWDTKFLFFFRWISRYLSPSRISRMKQHVPCSFNKLCSFISCEIH